MIYGLILAAGESRRMGQPKLLLPYGDKTVIETVFTIVKESKLGRSLVVVRPEDKIIPELARSFGFEVAINPEPARGMLSSIITGLESIPEEAEAVVLVLGDQPAIRASAIDLLIVGYRLKEKGLILPVFQGKRGHPILFDLKYRTEIKTLNPEIGLRQLMQQHPEDILEIPMNEPGLVVDLDTPEDYFGQLRTGPGKSEESKKGS